LQRLRSAGRVAELAGLVDEQQHERSVWDIPGGQRTAAQRKKTLIRTAIVMAGSWSPTTGLLKTISL
jgi:hypothetical protein